MNSAEAIKEVERRLREMRGFRAERVVDEATRKELIAREKEAEEGSRETKLLDVHNEGFWTTMGREVQLALLLDRDNDVINNTNRLLVLKDEEGKKLGEWVNEGKAKEMREREDVHFMGRDFVLYRGLEMKGIPYFVLYEVDFPFLEGVEGIRNVTSCSPSGPTDEFLRNWLGFREEIVLSHVVGFDLVHEEEGRSDQN